MTKITKVDLSGDEFGETYHIGAAMILTTCIPQDATCYGWKISFQEDTSGGKKPISDAQQTFLCAILYSPTYAENTPGRDGNDKLAKSACTEEIIAPAFSKAPPSARNVLSKCFLAESLANFDTTNGTMPNQMQSFIVNTYPMIAPAGAGPVINRAIIRLRNKPGQNRNMTAPLVSQIATSLNTNAGITEIIFVGETLPLPAAPANVTFYDLTAFLANQTFIKISGAGTGDGTDFSFAAQLMFYYALWKNFNVKMQIGMMSGAMDGTAFIGVPTIFFEEHTGAAAPATTRMGKAAAAITWMEQVTYAAYDYDSTDAAKDKMPPPTIAVLDAAITRFK